MPTVTEGEAFPDRAAFLAHCAAAAPSEGWVCEFGVWEGESLRILAGLFKPRTVYGFDSFEGLPEDWIKPLFPKGRFKLDALPAGMPSNVLLVPGMFEDTLPAFGLADKLVAFAHVDCDLFSSTKTVLEHIRFAPGAVVVFDEAIVGSKCADELAAWLESGIPARFLAQHASKRLALQVLNGS